MNVADAQTTELLELPAVLERVARFASFSAARAGVLALRPVADRQAVSARLELTAQGRQFLEVSPSFTVGGARDVRDRAERAARGARLDPADLLDVHDHLRATRLAVAAVGRQAAELPALWALVEAASDPPDLEGRISAAINEEAEVRDEASPELERLRRLLQQARGRLTRLLERLVQQVSADVLRERLVTERRGRLTVPVRRERQRDFPGVVHDVSASGLTVFMEPLAAIEAGNEIRSLEVAERQEVERILLELSAAVGAERERLYAAVQALADLDRTLAVARYADATNAIAPDVSEDTSFDLQAARHPLLETPVPIDVHLDGAQARALVITGANTGGKTVALKTVGLLHVMAACGLHVPAKAGSRVAVFERVVADIGDAQSIEHSLSTFASHVRNLRAMVEAAGPGALALADEIGAGTDPDEGAALGQAVIAALLERGATVVATTHHPALKAFAARTRPPATPAWSSTTPPCARPIACAWGFQDPAMPWTSRTGWALTPRLSTTLAGACPRGRWTWSKPSRTHNTSWRRRNGNARPAHRHAAPPNARGEILTSRSTNWSATATPCCAMHGVRPGSCCATHARPCRKPGARPARVAPAIDARRAQAWPQRRSG